MLNQNEDVYTAYQLAVYTREINNFLRPIFYLRNMGTFITWDRILKCENLPCFLA